MNTNKGIVYVATGKKYLEESLISVVSCKRTMPNLPICIFTDLEAEAKQKGIFDLVLPVPNPQYSLLDKVLVLKDSPFQKTIFIDTDTYVLHPFYDVFSLLDRFDLAAAHAPIRISIDSDCCPESFPEFNTGIIVYKKQASFDRFIDDWYSIFLRQLEIAKQRKNISEYKNDQPAFREAVYRSALRFSVLPSEYNLRAVFPYFIGGKSLVKIIHARGKYLERAIFVAHQHDRETKAPKVVNVKAENKVQNNVLKIKHKFKKTLKISPIGIALNHWFRSSH